MSSGGGSTETKSTVTQSNLPDYARPYFERLMERGEALSLSDYQPYDGPRLAEMSGATSASQDLTGQIAQQGIAGLPQAMQTVGGNMMAGQAIAAGSDPYQFNAAQRFTDPGVAESYMSPYMRNVLDVQKDQARRQFQSQEGARNAQAVNAGAFGGGRQAVMEGVAERGLMDRMANIEATGMQNAYQQAGQMFGADRTALMGQEQAQAGENRAAAGQQLNALGFAGQQAGQLAGFGEMGRAADIQNAQLLEALGTAQESRDQRGLDLGYEDFLRQQAYPEQQLQVLSSIMRGVPVEPSVTQIGYAPYNPLQQVMGAGLTGIGLYRGLSG